MVIKNELYRAIGKSISGRFSVYLLQFISLAIYARLFSPDEFGFLASIQVFVVFFQMLANVGFGPAIVNEKNFEPAQRDGVFSVTVLLALGMAFVFYPFSYVLNDFYDKIYQEVAIFVSISIFFNTLSILPVTALTKDTRFGTLAKAEIFAEIVTFAIVYSLYKQGYGILALASKTALFAFIKFSIAWFNSANTAIGRAKIGYELYHIKKLLNFSLYQFSFSVINYFSRNLDNILIGKYFGMASLGVYDKAYQLMKYPLMLTSFAMAPAIQPIVTKYKDDLVRVENEHCGLTKKLLLVSIPISVFTYFNCFQIVSFLFGSQWLSIVPVIKILSLIIPIQMIMTTSGSFFQALNKPKLLFYCGLISAVINSTGIIAGILIGNLEAVAICICISFSISFVQTYYILYRYALFSKIRGFYLSLFKVITTSLLPICIYILFYNAISSRLTNLDNSFFELCLSFILLILCYIPFFKKLNDCGS